MEPDISTFLSTLRGSAPIPESGFVHSATSSLECLGGSDSPFSSLMASLFLPSLSLNPPQSLNSSTSCIFCSGSGRRPSLTPIVVRGNPPTFVSAPGRRIVAVGDLHGDLEQSRYALEMAGVLSSDGRDLWTGGETVLIQLGDILDRGEDEIAILSLLRSLEMPARAAGGAVFQINKNHETMNVEGDFRYVDLGAFDECLDFMEYLKDHRYDKEEAFPGWIGMSERWKDQRKSQTHWGPLSLVKDRGRRG